MVKQGGGGVILRGKWMELNRYWGKKWGKKLLEVAKDLNLEWRFIFNAFLAATSTLPLWVVVGLIPASFCHKSLGKAPNPYFNQ